MADEVEEAMEAIRFKGSPVGWMHEAIEKELTRLRAEVERKDEGLKKAYDLIVANDSHTELNWLDDVRMVVFGALSPKQGGGQDRRDR